MPPKLRASCDVCHSAKVKCTKTATGCQRCDSSGGELACNYSPVLPRVYHKKGAHCNRVEDSQASSQPDSLAESSLLDDLYGPKSASQAALTDPIYAAAAAPVSTFDQQVYDYGVNTEPNPFFWPYAPLNSMAMSQAPNLWSSNISAKSSTTATPPLTDATTPSDAASTALFLPPTNRSRATTMEEANHFPSSISSPERNVAGKPCDCFDNLLQAMQSINTHMIARNPKLDVVLCANRTAAKLCLRSLQCPPTLRSAAHGTASSCVTIACGLLDRILSSYDAALHDFCANLDPQVDNGVEDLENEKDGGMAGEKNTATVELKLGSFALERSEQVLWARKIVAREVGRIQETLKGFGMQGQGVQGALLADLLDRCKSVIDQVSGS